DPSRWVQLLRILRGNKAIPLWRQFFGQTYKPLTLHGVISFCDINDLTAAASSSQQLERQSRECHDRLLAIGEVFKCDFPVYQVITKCDTIRYYPEYVGRIPESEVNQIFGCTFPEYSTNPSQAATNSVETEARRLLASFRSVYDALVDRRVS